MAIVGQESIKKALIWNIVNPSIGGVLISGEKGTAKSTLVRGVCNVMADIKLVEVPINVTEDRLTGNIDFEHAVKFGEKSFEGGIFQKAHGNLVYVDEVNLLSDHIVKILLETAGSGLNIVEREGISFRHLSQFTLIGSMNPEEGSLRPQFLDRFGLYVEVKGEEDLRKRAEIIRRRLEYEKNPSLFIKKWKSESEKLMLSIKRAKEDLNKVTITPNAMQLAVSIAKEGNCAGHRAEIIIIETAKAIAALDSRVILNISDIKEAAKYVLPHRVRNEENNIKDTQNDYQDNDKEIEEDNNENEENNNNENTEEKESNGELGNNNEQNSNSENDNSMDSQEESIDNGNNSDEMDSQEETTEEQETRKTQEETIDNSEEIFAVSKWLSEKNKNCINKGSGKRSLVKTSSTQGRYVRYRYPIKGNISDIAIDATIRAAAPYQLQREKQGRALSIEKSDIRVKVRERRTGNTIIFVVDASGSMGANKRMKAVKGAILSLLNDAYQKRDKVGMIAFRNNSAELLLGITRSVELAEKKLSNLPTGGRTPLAEGLNMAYDIVKAAKLKDKDMLPVIVLISDGKATYSSTSCMEPFKAAVNAAEKISSENIKTVVINTEETFVKLNLAEKIAETMNADCFRIEDLEAQDLVTAVKFSL